MTKRWLSIYVLMAMILVLGACTNENTNKENDEGSSNTTEPVDIEENDDNHEDGLEEDEGLPEEDDTSAEVDENNNDGEEIVDETDNFLNEAVQVDSDEQDYSIHLLPTYTLTSEEPGKDSLYLDEDGTVFMRIETMIAEDGTYDYLLENMLTTLAASGSETTEPAQLEEDASLPSGESIENVQAYTVNSDTGPVTGVIFEKDGMVVRLTIFDSPDAEHFDNFLSMGETITKTQ